MNALTTSTNTNWATAALAAVLLSGCSLENAEKQSASRASPEITASSMIESLNLKENRPSPRNPEFKELLETCLLASEACDRLVEMTSRSDEFPDYDRTQGAIIHILQAAEVEVVTAIKNPDCAEFHGALEELCRDLTTLSNMVEHGDLHGDTWSGSSTGGMTASTRANLYRTMGSLKVVQAHISN